MQREGTVGFIGLGNIGAPMASRLSGPNGALVVFDVHAPAMDPFVAEGAVAAADAAEVGALAEVVCIVVQDESQVESVLAGEGGLLQGAPAGTVVAVHSTISAEGAERLGRLAATHGVHLLDAPVSGGAIGAHEGSLAVMVGGEPEAVERARPVFERFASMVQHMGPVGAGTRTKIARNLITFAGFAVVGEAQRLAEAAGLDLGRLGEVVRHSDRVTGGLGAIMLRPTAGVMDADDGLRPIFGHTAELGAKDLHLAAEMAQRLGVEAPFAELAAGLLESALGLCAVPTRDSP
jgi:3-hydroxyisobutyrate dehydrogenase